MLSYEEFSLQKSHLVRLQHQLRVAALLNSGGSEFGRGESIWQGGQEVYWPQGVAGGQ